VKSTMYLEEMKLLADVYTLSEGDGSANGVDFDTDVWEDRA